MHEPQADKEEEDDIKEEEMVLIQIKKQCCQRDQGDQSIDKDRIFH